MTHCDRQSPLVINIRQNRSVVIQNREFPFHSPGPFAGRSSEGFPG